MSSRPHCVAFIFLALIYLPPTFLESILLESVFIAFMFPAATLPRTGISRTHPSAPVLVAPNTLTSTVLVRGARRRHVSPRHPVRESQIPALRCSRPCSLPSAPATPFIHTSQKESHYSVPDTTLLLQGACSRRRAILDTSSSSSRDAIFPTFSHTSSTSTFHHPSPPHRHIKLPINHQHHQHQHISCPANHRLSSDVEYRYRKSSLLLKASSPHVLDLRSSSNSLRLRRLRAYRLTCLATQD